MKADVSAHWKYKLCCAQRQLWVSSGGKVDHERVKTNQPAGVLRVHGKLKPLEREETEQTWAFQVIAIKGNAHEITEDETSLCAKAFLNHHDCICYLEKFKVMLSYIASPRAVIQMFCVLQKPTMTLFNIGTQWYPYSWLWITSSTLSLMIPSPSLSKALKAPAEVANRPGVTCLMEGHMCWKPLMKPQLLLTRTEHALQPHKAADVAVEVDVEMLVCVSHRYNVVQLVVEMKPFM